MAPRPYWKGYLKLTLVSCAVALFPATSTRDRISFNWLNRETGNRLRQQMVDSETGNPVEREDRVRGYQLSKNDYLQIEEDELEAVEIESSHTIEIERFVPRDEIDPVYFENSYYLAPDDRVAEEAFSVIRAAMEAEDVVGIARVVLARRERLVALEPRGKGILLTLLHYNYEVRADGAYFEEIPEIAVAGEMLDLAKHIIRQKSGHFDPMAFEDRYENALIELVRAKQAGRPVELARPQQPSNVVNLMDALRRSIAADKDTEPAGIAPEGRQPGADEDGAREERPRAKRSAAGSRGAASAGRAAEGEGSPRRSRAETDVPRKTRRAS